MVVLGGGGHARVLAAMMLRDARLTVVGFTAPAPDDRMASLAPYLGTDDELLRFDPAEVELVNGVGSVGSTALRANLHSEAIRKGFRFRTLRDASALVCEAEIEAGAQLMAGCIVQYRARIGVNAIINTRAVVEHDCMVGAHAHIASGAVLAGGVVAGDRAHIGAGASVRQGIRIGAGAVVGVGAAVVNDVPADCTVVGVPARPIRRSAGTETHD